MEQTNIVIDSNRKSMNTRGIATSGPKVKKMMGKLETQKSIAATTIRTNKTFKEDGSSSGGTPSRYQQTSLS
jgi:hypothetical protein